MNGITCWSCNEVSLPNPKTGEAPSQCFHCGVPFGSVSTLCLDCGHDFFPEPGWNGVTCPNPACPTNQPPGDPDYIELGSRGGFAVGSFSRET
jgi:hypothetical protein